MTIIEYHNKDRDTDLIISRAVLRVSIMQYILLFSYAWYMFQTRTVSYLY